MSCSCVSHFVKGPNSNQFPGRSNCFQNWETWCGAHVASISVTSLRVGANLTVSRRKFNDIYQLNIDLAVAAVMWTGMYWASNPPNAGNALSDRSGKKLGLCNTDLETFEGVCRSVAAHDTGCLPS